MKPTTFFGTIKPGIFDDSILNMCVEPGKMMSSSQMMAIDAAGGVRRHRQAKAKTARSSATIGLARNDAT